MHRAIAERMLDAVTLDLHTPIVEIGPGTGALTRVLLARGFSVIAIETDPELYDRLLVDFASDIARGALKVWCQDIRTFDTRTLPPHYNIVANIPYYLTGEILRLFLSGGRQPLSMTLLVQREVATRIARAKKESLLSLSVKAYGTPRYVFTVPRGSFAPAPKVDSAVLTIAHISHSNFLSAAHEKRFFDIIHAAFAHKRKIASKNLKEAGFEGLELPLRARAEDIPLSTWLTVAQKNL